MSRNSGFHPDREPMRDNDALQLNSDKVTGPIAFLNPTSAHYDHVLVPGSETEKEAQEETDTSKDKGGLPCSDVSFKWTSRNNRKGRHAIVVKPTTTDQAVCDTPTPSSDWRNVLSTIWRMVVFYPVWDISWWVAYIFTWGSIIWVINAFFVFLPLTNPSTEFANEESVGGGVTAFIGATVFEIGSVLLMIEAVNENRASCFGWAVERVYADTFGHGQTNGNANGESAKSEKSSVLKIRPAKDKCKHHHQNRDNFVGLPQQSVREDVESQSKDDGSRSWTWFPSMQELRSHYFHDLGFLACCAQMAGASIFWISGFTALPGILNNLSPKAETWAYWFPQVLGGSGFIISGILFMIETQKHWYQPALKVLGWWIGLFNLIGGLGFTLCPCFGFDSASWAQYQASCSTFWGSWAFLIGSLIQLYESLEKNPVEVEKD